MEKQTKEAIKVLEDNKLTNIYSPEDQVTMQKTEEKPKDNIEENIKWVLKDLYKVWKE